MSKKLRDRIVKTAYKIGGWPTRKMKKWPPSARLVKLWGDVNLFSAIYADVLDITNRQNIFETQQLPVIIQNLAQVASDVNNCSLPIDEDKDNLVKSVPVSIRKITRDHSDIMTHLEGVTNSLQYLMGRIEFVRRELMFELRYGASQSSCGEGPFRVKNKILSPEKLEIARKNILRLNLGCGHISLEGYLNVDRRDLSGVDIVAEADDLPFHEEEIDEIYSAHFLEHFPQEQLRRQLLPKFYTMLKVGGVFRAVVPDAKTMIEQYVACLYEYDDMREVMYGAQDYDGDFHYNMFTPESLMQLLTESGFINLKIIESGRKNGHCFEFEISAQKPGR